MFRSQVVPLFVARLVDLGIDTAPLMRELSLPIDVTSRREVDVPLGVIHALSLEVERLSGDRRFGLHVATWLPRGAYGLLEFIVRSARDVREAATRLVRYHRMLNDLTILALEETRDEVILRHWIPGHSEAAGRHGNELIIALMVRVLRESIASEHWSPRRIAFCHQGSDDGELAAYFGVERVAFGRAHNEVAVALADLGLPLASADSALLSVLDEQAMRLLTAKPQGDDFSVRLRETIRVSLRNGAPRLDMIAHDLGTSTRTLQRRLEARGMSFQALVDDIRRELACMYVEARSLREVEIAFLLGYAERRAFTRAFKRWTGATPAVYRRG